VGDVETLTKHITMLHDDPSLLQKLRAGAIGKRLEYTWSAAGVKLLQVYGEIVAGQARQKTPEPVCHDR
jgi:hypothetical protein